jgi:hypothetical protein
MKLIEVTVRHADIGRLTAHMQAVFSNAAAVSAQLSVGSRGAIAAKDVNRLFRLKFELEGVDLIE